MNNHTGPVGELLRLTFFSAVSGLFLHLIYHWAGMFVHFLLLKVSYIIVLMVMAKKDL